MIRLTSEERRKVAAWLREQSIITEDWISKAKKKDLHHSMLDQLKFYMAAQILIAQSLEYEEELIDHGPRQKTTA